MLKESLNQLENIPQLRGGGTPRSATSSHRLLRPQIRTWASDALVCMLSRVKEKLSLSILEE